MPILLSKLLKSIPFDSNIMSGYILFITIALSIAIVQGSNFLESVTFIEKPLHILPLKEPFLGTNTAGKNSTTGSFNSFNLKTKSVALSIFG